MKKISSALFIIVFILFTGARAHAFVPQTPHLLDMVVKKIKRPMGLTCHQVRMEIIEDGTEEPLTSETLFYDFPEHLRTESDYPNPEDVQERWVRIFSDIGFVKLKDGAVFSWNKALEDHENDLLLYREPQRMTQELEKVGIDISYGVFRRDEEGVIYYVVGRPGEDPSSYPSLWVEKDTLFPARYILEKDGKKMAFHYKNWQRFQRSWYPMETLILVDDVPTARIRVENVKLKAGFPSAFFKLPRGLDPIAPIVPVGNRGE